MTDWYEQNIEPEIRPLVRLLRDNGFNTECSCGHDMYVQIALTHDGELQRLDYLLFNGGYRDYSIMLELRREDGWLLKTTNVIFKNQKEKSMNQDEVLAKLCKRAEAIGLKIDNWGCDFLVREYFKLPRTVCYDGQCRVGVTADLYAQFAKTTTGFTMAELFLSALERERARVVPVPEPRGYWWCPECKREIDGHQVTHQEIHEACGYLVEWKELPAQATGGKYD